MILRTLFLTGFLLALTDCGQYQQAGGPNPSNPPPAGGGEPAPAGANPGFTPPKIVSVSIRVECRDPVNVFYGDDPKFGSGTSSRLGGNSIQNNTRQAGDMIWITDEQRNGIGSVTISENTREVVVACNGISAR